VGYHPSYWVLPSGPLGNKLPFDIYATEPSASKARSPTPRELQEAEGKELALLRSRFQKALCGLRIGVTLPRGKRLPEPSFPEKIKHILEIEFLSRRAEFLGHPVYPKAVQGFRKNFQPFHGELPVNPASAEATSAGVLADCWLERETPTRMTIKTKNECKLLEIINNPAMHSRLDPLLIQCRFYNDEQGNYHLTTTRKFERA
jgi:hypothetical protein